MNINFKYSFYFHNESIEMSADLNVDKEYYKKLKNILKIKKLKDFEMTRVGLAKKDGAYIMANDFGDGNTAYSFGISDNVDWDNIMAELGYDIYMYDHTIQNLPYKRDKFHFFKEGISGTDKDNEPLKTLEYYINKNGHQNNKNMILKMDVEGAEWDFLETVDLNTLNQFDQLVFEFHNIVRAGYGDKILNLLEKINKTHQLIHLHGNNSGYILKIGNTTFPDVIEASYVNNEKYKTFDTDDVILPTELDYPNIEGRSDVCLGKWNQPIIFE